MSSDRAVTLEAMVRRFKPYPAYKDSGVEWLGKIPAHWEVRRLKTFTDVQLSNVDKKSVDGEEPVRLCNYVDVYYNERITADMDFMPATATPDQIRRFSLRRGDVLITKDSESWTDIAVAAVVEEDLPGVVAGYHLAHIRPRPQCDGAFLAYAFSAIGPRDQFHVSANGITRFGLSASAIRAGLFAIPPLEEQRRIVIFLQRETARVDTLVARKERLLTLLEERRVVLVSRAVTKGLEPNAPMKDSRIEWLGEIPAHWDVTPLRWALSIRSGDALPNGHFEPAISDTRRVPVIGGNGIMGYTNRANVFQPCIAVGRVGALCGNVHPINPPAWITDNALLLSDITGFDRDYLASLLDILDLRRWSSQNAQPLVTGGMIKALRVCRPPLDEQKRIGEHIREVDASSAALSARIRDAIDRLKEFRAALISAAVTGQIDVREEVA